MQKQINLEPVKSGAMEVSKRHPKGKGKGTVDTSPMDERKKKSIALACVCRHPQGGVEEVMST